MKSLRSFFALVVGVLLFQAPRASIAKPAKLGLIGVNAYGAPNELATRLRAAVLNAINDQRVEAVDLADTHSFVQDCEIGLPIAVLLKEFDLDYTISAALEGAHIDGKPGFSITINIGRVPRGKTREWGPWSTRTTCKECSEADVIAAGRLLVGRAWKAMVRAEMSSDDIAVSAREKADKGAKILQLMDAPDTSVPEQIYLAKKALRAGAGRKALVVLAKLFFRYDLLEEAEEYAQRAATLGEDMHRLLGPIFYLTGRWREALPEFELKAKELPDNETVREQLAEVKKRLENPLDAVGQAEEALATGDPFLADRIARMAMRSGGFGWKPHLIYAESSLKTRSFCTALAYFTWVLTADPSNKRALAGKQAALEGMRKEQAALGRPLGR